MSKKNYINNKNNINNDYNLNNNTKNYDKQIIAQYKYECRGCSMPLVIKKINIKIFIFIIDTDHQRDSKDHQEVIGARRMCRCV